MTPSCSSPRYSTALRVSRDLILRSFRFCECARSRRARERVGAWAAQPGLWPPATPHGQAPAPYLYKTPPKNISDPKNSRVTAFEARHDAQEFHQPGCGGATAVAGGARE